ncbi:MAG: hypothetical protein JXB48_15085 [Candidatus Latescibacteria bacterium]|nr:hypothetical protein [Candidatus Latescibacterota bacterium]
MSESKNIIEKFSSDRPIFSRDNDSLGRKEFAESLASAIKGWHGNDSLVLALYGAWGSGKSSIKNMVLETLKESKDTCPEIIEFNPWQWSGQEKLVKVFFQEIGKAIGRNDKSEVNKKLAKQFKRYGTYLHVGSSIAKSFYSILFLVFSIISFIGGSNYASISYNIISYILGTLALIIFIIFQIGDSFEKFADMFEASYSISKQPISELKREISEKMKQLSNNVFIVIDDIDRLASDEIKLIFRLIKSNADFPKIIYFLLFQRDIVEKCLCEEISPSDPSTGKEYLEKIVQVGFDIPQVEKSKIHKFLNNELKNILGENVIESKRWGILFKSGINAYFQNLRDVKRFISTLQFHIAIFRKEGTSEVNFIDLCAIEVLRTFEPSLYNSLPKCKMILLGYDFSLIPDEEEKNRHKITSIIDTAYECNRSYVRKILIELFPTINHLLNENSYFRDCQSEWLVDKRICTLEYFDRYFLLRISEDNISQTDFENVMSLLSDRKKLLSQLRKLNENEKIHTFLFYIYSYAHDKKIDQKYTEPLITTLFDIGDDLPEKSNNIYSSAHWIIIDIANQFLQYETDYRKKWQILKDTICNSKGIFVPVQFVKKLEYEMKNNEEYFLRESDIKYLQNELIIKIKQPSKIECFLSYPKKLNIILEAWNNWSTSKEPQKRTEELVATKDGLLSFLEGFVETRESSHLVDGSDFKKEYNINLSKIEKFISIDILVNNIKKQSISSENLTGNSKKAFDIFNLALERKKNGMIEDDNWIDM